MRCPTRSPDPDRIRERATLYSSTEFKKIRLLYFTEDSRTGRAHTLDEVALSNAHLEADDPPLTDTRSAALYEPARSS